MQSENTKDVSSVTCDKKNEDYISIISFIIVVSSIMIIEKL